MSFQVQCRFSGSFCRQALDVMHKIQALLSKAFQLKMVCPEIDVVVDGINVELVGLGLDNVGLTMQMNFRVIAMKYT